jgi:hypothetical protein
LSPRSPTIFSMNVVISCLLPGAVPVVLQGSSWLRMEG